MTNPSLNLDREIERLRSEVGAGDTLATKRRLAGIEALLEALDNPLVRGFAYAEVRAALGQPAEAAGVLDDLLAVIGDDAVAYFQLGCYRRQAGDDERAAQAFAAAVRIDPSRIDAWLNLGTILDDRAEPEAAIDAYRQALRIAPSDLHVWRNLGNSLAALGRFEESISAYETGLGLSPGERTLVLLRAAAYQALGDLERANALTPAALAQEVGTVVEVADAHLCCRFRCRPDRLARRKEAAATVLADARSLQMPGEGSSARGQAGFYLVRRGSQVLVCDPDPVRPGCPHRFFDASETLDDGSGV